MWATARLESLSRASLRASRAATAISVVRGDLCGRPQDVDAGGEDRARPRGRGHAPSRTARRRRSRAEFSGRRGPRDGFQPPPRAAAAAAATEARRVAVVAARRVRRRSRRVRGDGRDASATPRARFRGAARPRSFEGARRAATPRRLCNDAGDEDHWLETVSRMMLPLGVYILCLACRPIALRWMERRYCGGDATGSGDLRRQVMYRPPAPKSPGLVRRAAASAPKSPASARRSASRP